jgi:hypothetical protein
MRRMFLLVLGAAVVGCASYSSAPSAAPLANRQGQADFARLTAGKIAGPAVPCINTYRSRNDDMYVIDEDTVLFRESSTRVWRNDIPGGCPGLGWGHNALVFNNISGTQLCRGDYARVVDATTGIMAGTCSLGAFVPYTAPRR